MMSRLSTNRQTVLIDLVPELLPTPLTEHECTKAQDDTRAPLEPAPAGATKPLFDERLAGRLGDPGANGQVLSLIAG
jgi:hypothetical protein